jgi:hypothetical protein
LKDADRHAVPWFVLLSRYFHDDPLGTTTGTKLNEPVLGLGDAVGDDDAERLVDGESLDVMLMVDVSLDDMLADGGSLGSVLVEAEGVGDRDGVSDADEVDDGDTSTSTSSMSKLRSLLLVACWCSSTAITFVPDTNSVGDTENGKNVVSSAFAMARVARVVHDTTPVGMLLRNASTPFTYTTAPSSRSRFTVAVPMSARSAMENVLRKYVVMGFTVAAPPATSVASPPSP